MVKIDTSKIEVSFTFSPATHFLVFDYDERLPNGKNADGDLLKVWSLCPRIDRSYKGKDDDIGIPEIYLNEKDAEACKKAGFTWLQL